MFKTGWVLGLALLMSACITVRTRVVQDTVHTTRRDTMYVTRIDTVRVTTAAVEPDLERVYISRLFFGTNRAMLRETGSFLNQRAEGNQLRYGFINVTIPRLAHETGRIELAPWYVKMLGPIDPEKYFTLDRPELLDSKMAFDSLSSLLARREAGDSALLLFVHGYNNSFDDAALRVAQFTYDLRFPGQPLLFSWASRDNFLSYFTDAGIRKESVDALIDMLEHLSRTQGSKRLVLVAHSMGADIATSALRSIAERQLPLKFSEIVLAAPDIDESSFWNVDTKFLMPLTARATIYASARDIPLQASRQIQKSARLGLATIPPKSIPNLDFIDASGESVDLLGHSTFAQSFALLADIRAVLRSSPHSERSWLCRLAIGNKQYFRIARGKKQPIC